MGASLDSLLESWKSQPDAATTILLCDQLGQSGQPKLVEEVGRSASVKHASNPEVLLAIGRMYLHAYRLGDAQGLLVSAGKMAPRNPDIYRWLGEVLLRRGDAARASKILERAVVLGKTDDETEFWRAQAAAHTDLQAQSGPQKVVAALSEVLREKGLPLPPPPSKRISGAQAIPSPRAHVPSDAEVTVTRRDPTQNSAEPSAVPPSDRTPVEVPRRIESPPPLSSPFAQVGKPASSARPISVPPPTPPRPSESSKPPSAPRPSGGPSDRAAVTSVERPSVRRSPRPEPLAAPAPANEPAIAPASAETTKAEPAKSATGPAGGAALAREPPPKTRSRFSIALLVLAAVFFLSGLGVLVYMRDKRAKRTEARALDAEVSKLLRGGKLADLPGTETKLARAFDLDPKSRETALLWLRNRVMKWFEAEGDSSEIEAALSRARRNFVAESDVVFARIASLLAQGDGAGATALVPQGDERTKTDPYFQLLAGVALERAGDPRATERFQLAVNLDPDFVPGQVMLARAVALESDRGRAGELARGFRGKWPDRAEASALVALGWARDPARGALPPEAETAKNHRDELPQALRGVPSAVEALQAIEKSSAADAKAAIERGLQLANTPAVAAWLGTIALETGDDAMARRAAQQAIAASANYPGARALTARIALAGGRLDEALNAVTELEPTLPDVAIVRGVVAYERLDLEGLSLWGEGLSPATRAQPELAALTKAIGVMRGDAGLDPTKLRALAAPGVAWGDVIAVDAALITGALPLAKELTDRFREAKDLPPNALRISHHLRSTGHAADADAPSRTALGMATARAVVERVLVLQSTDRADEARTLVAKNGSLLGPMAPWLLVYIDAKGPRAAETRAKAAALEPPGPGAPMLWRVVTALAMADLGDKKRGVDFLRQLSKAVPRNPEVVAADERLRK